MEKKFLRPAHGRPDVTESIKSSNSLYVTGDVDTDYAGAEARHIIKIKDRVLRGYVSGGTFEKALRIAKNHPRADSDTFRRVSDDECVVYGGPTAIRCVRTPDGVAMVAVLSYGQTVEMPSYVVSEISSAIERIKVALAAFEDEPHSECEFNDVESAFFTRVRDMSPAEIALPPYETIKAAP